MYPGLLSQSAHDLQEEIESLKNQLAVVNEEKSEALSQRGVLEERIQGLEAELLREATGIDGSASGTDTLQEVTFRDAPGNAPGLQVCMRHGKLSRAGKGQGGTRAAGCQIKAVDNTSFA
jgi:hypothetical protein